MSLSLIQSYSSADEEEEQHQQQDYSLSSDEDDDYDSHHPASAAAAGGRTLSYKSVLDQSAPSNVSSSGLPSALDAFSEISGPPNFLNNSVEELQSSVKDAENQTGRHGGRWRKRRDKKDLPAGNLKIEDLCLPYKEFPVQAKSQQCKESKFFIVGKVQ
ncbi:conserved hypothetical protein [Ricinus communis]|uniref:Uncharacterized protein n=1 Tax=Ricinus communis TaxID=3988 RepID=B9SWA2_RICCO|nr:conserved hypothetical protein [Ricinus communis]